MLSPSAVLPDVVRGLPILPARGQEPLSDRQSEPAIVSEAGEAAALVDAYALLTRIAARARLKLATNTESEGDDGAASEDEAA